MLGPCPGLSLGQSLEDAWLARSPRWRRRWLRRGCGAFGHPPGRSPAAGSAGAGGVHGVTPGHGQCVEAARHPWAGYRVGFGWAAGPCQGLFMCPEGAQVCARRGAAPRGVRVCVWLCARLGMRRTCPPTPVHGCVRGVCARGRAPAGTPGACSASACERCRVCPRAGAGGRAVDNALFSFPLQKTGHSRRFGRFTHGALSYQDLAPPPCRGGGGKLRLRRAGHGSEMGLGAPGIPRGACSCLDTCWGRRMVAGSLLQWQ